MTPPAFVFVGIIWRDILFATCWLLAAAIAFAAAERGRELRLTGQVLALVLCCLRCLVAAERAASPRRSSPLTSPGCRRVSLEADGDPLHPGHGGYSLYWCKLVYYGMLDAKRQHPLQTIMIFDLGGISHFPKQNQFPVDWSKSEDALLLNNCYQPTQWDIYWRLEPCDFVMRKVEREKRLFGTSAIRRPG